MSNNRVVLPAHFDASKISFGQVKEMGGAGMAKMLPVRYDNGPLIIQTPTNMVTKFGVSMFEKTNKYHLDLNIDENNTDHTLFKTQVCQGLDNAVLEEFAKNSVSYLKDEYTTKQLKMIFSPSLKAAKEPYPPYFKPQVPWKDGHFTCDVYNASKEKINLSEMIDDTKGATVTALVRCGGVWFTSKGFGVIWRVEQMKITPRPYKLSGYAFVDDESDHEIPDAASDN